MQQLREAAGTGSSKHLSVRQMAQRLGLQGPISALNLFQTLVQPNKLHETITTPPGTALGGWAELELRPDGGFTFSGHMHDSGVDPYDFRVMGLVQSPTVAFVFQHSGHVDGTGSDPLGSPKRYDDWNETGNNPLVQVNWLDARTATMAISKSYQDVGLAGGAEDLLRLFTSWWLTEAVFGPEVAIVIVLGSELGSLTGARFADPSGLVGVAVAGATILVFGPGVMIPAIVAGVAAGAVVQHKTLYDDEEALALAKLVFGDTLPTDRIVLTNLSGLGGRDFTMPNVDGTILVHLGDGFKNPAQYTNNSYPVPGQVFIHELTHTWQIQYTQFTPGLICEGLVTQARYSLGEDVYKVGQADHPWSWFNLEAQAAIVDSWFGKHAAGWVGLDDAQSKLNSAAAINDPYFGYISNNIRLKQG